MEHFEGFGTCHPDLEHPEVKKSIHSFIIRRSSDGLVRVRWKEYMHTKGYRPDKPQDGPKGGWQMFKEGFAAHELPELFINNITQPAALPESVQHI